MQGSNTLLTPQDNAQLNEVETGQQRIALESLPVRAWLAFTSRCNLNCLHCPRGSASDRPRSEMDMEPSLFQRIEKQLLPYLNACRVGGNNLGEQTLARQCDDYLKRLSDYPMARCLVTNGTALKPETAKILVAYGWTVDFSTESATEDTYRQIRHADFERFLGIVRETCRSKAQFGSNDSVVRFAFTAFYDNLDQLPELVTLTESLGVDEIVVTHLIPMSEAQRFQSLAYHRGLSNQVFRVSAERAQKLGIPILLPPPFAVRSMESASDVSREQTSSAPPLRCLHPWTSISIDEQGDVYPCCIYEKPLGNLHKSDLVSIWNGKRYRHLRKTVNSHRPPSNCQHCPLRGSTYTSHHCNDAESLLRQIGPTDVVDSSFFFRMKVRQFLNRSSLGSYLLRRRNFNRR